jgi:hypothetical protein
MLSNERDHARHYPLAAHENAIKDTDNFLVTVYGLANT